MTDMSPSQASTSRLPDWWRAKPTKLPASTPAPEVEPGAEDSSDWWDELYRGDDVTETTQASTTDTSEPGPAPGPGGPGWWTPQPGYYPGPHLPAFLTDPPPRIALSPKTRAALYNGSAAGAGWSLGLYDQFAHAIASCGSEASVSGALVLGAGGCLLIAHVWDRRTRHWWPGLAWAARIPLASAVLALALWAPAAA
ncbi:hypothetical protein [Streptomyces sp. NPDC021356]|uniref:hypothetical protein n=1 Tax=Streptomyces sp. NPDC021356 TaxID=3154900 RepID=UPI0033EDD0CC